MTKDKARKLECAKAQRDELLEIVQDLFNNVWPSSCSPDLSERMRAAIKRAEKDSW